VAGLAISAGNADPDADTFCLPPITSPVTVRYCSMEEQGNDILTLMVGNKRGKLREARIHHDYHEAA
jgi:hypothetical protein